MVCPDRANHPPGASTACHLGDTSTYSIGPIAGVESFEVDSVLNRSRLCYYVHVLNELAEGDLTDRFALCRQMTPGLQSSEV